MKLIVKYPSGGEEHVEFAAAETIIGSSPDCDIVVSDDSVEARQLKVVSRDGALEIENLSSKTVAWLDDQPIVGSVPLLPGDAVRVGSVTMMVLCDDGDAYDLTKSSDGVRAMWKSINRDVRSGWLGYRRVMEKLSRFISTEEAEQASDCYDAGRLFFFRALVVLFAGGLTAAVLDGIQWYGVSDVLSIVVQFLCNVSILLLVGRFHMAFAGRILYPLMFISQSTLYAKVPYSEYWSDLSLGVPLILVLGLALGWMMDYGAGFVFEKARRRRSFRHAMLLLAACLLVCLDYVFEYDTPSPLPWGLRALAQSPCIIWGFVHRLFLNTSRIPQDSQFVAEIASRRAWKRLLYQILALVLLAFPVIGVLALFGDDERRRWPNDDPDVLWTDRSKKDEAWFWKDRGRYLRVSDLDANRFYQIPISHLAAEASTNEFVLAASAYIAESGEGSSFTNTLADLMTRIFEQKRYQFHEDNPDLPAKDAPEYDKLNEEYDLACRSFKLSDFAIDLCERVYAVSTNSHDASAYAALCERLDDYRVAATNSVQFAKSLGLDSVCVMCDSVKCHPEYAKEDDTVYSAGFQIGVLAFTREKVAIDHADRVKREVGIWPLFVLAALAVMILYRRGADSAVGFWLGLGIFTNVLVLAEWVAGFSDGIPDHVKHALWHGAFSNPLSALSAAWMAVVMSVKDLFKYLGVLSQSVLFVILCWPTVLHVTKWKRRFAFVGKTLLALAAASLVGAAVGFIVSPSILVVRPVVVVFLSGWGWWLRRNRRAYTEIPRLGRGFFFGWLAAELAIAVSAIWIGVDLGDVSDDCVSAWLSEFLSVSIALPLNGMKVEIGAVLCVALSILVMVCWIWLFLKQRFLNVISVGGMTAILFVFALPLASNIFGGIMAEFMQDNVFISSVGMQLVSAIVCVVLFPSIMRTGRKLIRRFFMREVYRMEQDVASAIERIFDESANTKDSIANVLSCMGISSFVFYERETKDDFSAILSRNWADQFPVALHMSAGLRGLLGNRREVIDFAQLPYRPEYFFVSFELWRMHLMTGGTLMLPICLGASVRGLLFVRTITSARMPTDPSLVASINSFGLSAVTPR